MKPYTAEEKSRLPYRAASVLFLNPVTKTFFLGLEREKNAKKRYHHPSFVWKHFGGKIERCDNLDSFETARRELREETGGQLEDLWKMGYDYSFVDKDSKMVVYVKICSRALIHRLNTIRPAEVKLKYAWIDHRRSLSVGVVPDFVQNHIEKALELLCRCYFDGYGSFLHPKCAALIYDHSQYRENVCFASDAYLNELAKLGYFFPRAQKTEFGEPLFSHMEEPYRFKNQRTQ